MVVARRPADRLLDHLLGGQQVAGRQVHQRELRPAPRGVLRVRGAGVDRLAHEPRGAPYVTGDEQQMRGPAVGRNVRAQVEHPLIVLGGQVVFAELQRRVAEQAVRGGVRRCQRQGFPGRLDRLLELVPRALDPRQTDERIDVGRVERPRPLERLLGAAVVARVRGLTRLLHEGVAERGPRRAILPMLASSGGQPIDRWIDRGTGWDGSVGAVARRPDARRCAERQSDGQSGDQQRTRCGPARPGHRPMDPCGSSARRAAWPSMGRPGCRPGRWR